MIKQITTRDSLETIDPRDRVKAKQLLTAQDMMGKGGGTWLKVMREFIQWNAIHGDTVHWGSTECVHFDTMPANKLEHLAAAIAAAALNDAGGN